MVLRAGLLDERKRGNLPACQAGPSQALLQKRPSVYHFPGGGTQQETRHYPRENHRACGRPAPRRTVCQTENPRLGCVGQRSGQRFFPVRTRNEVTFYGLCNCPQGFNQGQIQGSIRADETPAHLFWRCAAGRRPAFLFDPGPRPDQRGGAHYGVCHAAGLSAGALRKTRPAP